MITKANLADSIAARGFWNYLYPYGPSRAYVLPRAATR